MDVWTRKYVNGEIPVPDKITLGVWKLHNYLCAPVLVNVIWAGGVTFLMSVLGESSGGNDENHLMPVNCYFLITALDGSIITVLPPSELQPPPGPVNYNVYGITVSSPNHIGPIPEPTSDAPIPCNSPSIMVGCGQINGLFCIRSQYYALAADSLYIAADEEFTTGFTVTFGTTASSSSSETVAASLSMSASAGWGPISSSISASLNTSSTMTQTYSSFETQTRYQTDVYKGNKQDMTVILKWQLMDTVTLYDSTLKPVASINNALSPIIKREYHNLELSPKPKRLVSKEMMDQMGAICESARLLRATSRR